MEKKVISAVLLLVILSSSFYFVFDDKVRIDIEKTRNKYSVYKDDSFVLAATEYVYLFDGSTKLRANSRSIEYYIQGETTNVLKEAHFKDGISLYETIIFNNEETDIEKVPIEHFVQVVNGDNLILQVEYRDITYGGETKVINSPFSFGNNMKLEWDESDAYYSKVFQQSVASDKIIVKSRIDGYFDVFNFRLFDPPTNLYLQSFERNITAELGSIVNASGVGSGVICLDVDHPQGGVNLSCDNDSVQYNINITYFRRDTFNDSTTTSNFLVENANESIPINYSFSNISAWTNPQNLFDGNCSSSASSVKPNNTVNFTHTKVSGAISSTLKIRGFASGYQTFDTPTNCFDASPSNVTYRIRIVDYPSDTSEIYWECYNSTGWETFYERNVEAVRCEESFMNVPYDTGVEVHQYDELINISFNLTSDLRNGNFSQNVKVYVNGTLSNSIGLVTNSTKQQITVFNDSSTSKNVTFSNEATSVGAYLDLPKTANITGTTLDLTGFNYTAYDPDVDAGNSPFTMRDVIGQSFIATTNYINNISFRVRAETAVNTTPIWLSTTFNGSVISSCNIIISNTATRFVDCEINTAVTKGNTYWINANWSGTGSNSYRFLGGNVNAYPNGGFQYSTNDFSTNDLDFRILGTSKPTDVWFEAGDVNGTRDFEYIGELDTNTTTGFNSGINTFLNTCTAYDGFNCYVPLTFYSETMGIIQLDDLVVNYTYDINPIILDFDLVETYLNNTVGFGDLPIRISGDGNLTISDLRYDYKGGNDTVKILLHDSSYSNNISYYIKYFYSDWNLSLPSNVDYIEFLPSKSDSKNVTPYKQKSDTPIFNITSTSYGGKTFNFSVLINESFSCVNLTISDDSSKSNGTYLINSTWVYTNTGVDYLDNFGLWMWADLNCNYSQWTLWDPQWSFRACCTGCDVCSEDT